VAHERAGDGDAYAKGATMTSRGGAAITAVAASTLTLAGCLQTTELGGASSFATGAGGVTAGAQGAQGNLPKCDAPLGTVALVED
jgi:hypothetical protein